MRPIRAIPLLAALLAITFSACKPSGPQRPDYDVLIRGGIVYDGTGGAGRRVDVGIKGDRVTAVGDLSSATGAVTIDATGLAVAPGFINMLSWSVD